MKHREYKEVLSEVWGYSEFRPLQEEIIRSILSGHDTVALLPTGGGKSLTYQLPAIAADGVAIVVTPLIALMKDQVDRLRKMGVQAVAINSSMSYREIDIALDNCVYGDIKILYIAPERIETTIFRHRVIKMDVSLIAVDEAHCISQWGYDFRPSYLKISTLRQLLPDVPVIAVTATATQAVMDDISDKLSLNKPKIFRASFARDNLSFVVRECDNKQEQILRIIAGIPTGSGIIYVRTRANAEKIAEYLKSNSISADFYHAGLTFQMRSRIQAQWTEGKSRIIVATNAFGMGIDKADVRFVIHHQPPESIESYYQEAGRAGRDGSRSYAVILYNDLDKTTASRRIVAEYPEKEKILEIYDQIFNYLQIAIGGGKDESRNFKLWEFSTRYNIFTLTALNAIKILELNGYMTLTDEIDNPTRIIFRVKRDELYKTQLKRVDFDGFIKVLLRNYTGLFVQFVAIDESYLSQISGYTEERIAQMLQALSQANIIQYIPRRRSPLLILEEERLPRADVLIAASTYDMRRGQSELKLAGMIEYCEQTEQCRSMLLRNYFDEPTTERCGVCDICIEQRDDSQPKEMKIEQLHSIELTILQLLENNHSHTIHSLLGAIPLNANRVLTVLRQLIKEGKVKQLSNGGLRIS